MLGFSWMKSYRRCVPVEYPATENAWHEVLSRVVDDAFLLQFNKSVREHLGEAAQMLLAFQTCGDSVDDAADAQLNGVAIVYAIDDDSATFASSGVGAGTCTSSSSSSCITKASMVLT